MPIGPALTILGQYQAERVIAGQHMFTHLVSIREAGRKRGLVGYTRVPRWLFLAFDDTDLNVEGAPQPKHIRALLQFAGEIRTALQNGYPANLLVHCAMGVSRSTAAAYIILAEIYGRGHEKRALADVVNVRPIAHPNERMVNLADKIMRRDGALVQTRVNIDRILTEVARGGSSITLPIVIKPV